MEGMSRPPLALERKIRAGSADLLRPHHFFRSLVASGSRVRSTQVSGRSVRDRSHVRQGQMQGGRSSTSAAGRAGTGQ